MVIDKQYAALLQNIDTSAFDKNIQRLTNQLWKLIPMREKEEDWQKQLDTVIIEVAGLNTFISSPSFLQLLSKLIGLREVETDFDVYRKTVFEMINLLQEIRKNL